MIIKYKIIPNFVFFLKESLMIRDRLLDNGTLGFDSFALILASIEANSIVACISNLKVITILFLLYYIDDILLIDSNMNLINEIKTALNSEFDMKALDGILDMEIRRVKSNSVLFLNQAPYASNVLRKFDILESRAGCGLC